jgi:hypothetical protein
VARAPWRFGIDEVDEEAWNAVLAGFDDAILYQTWRYGAERWGEANLSHVILDRNGTPVAAAQIALVRLPVLGSGVAYLNWGPLWRPRGQEADPAVLGPLLERVHEHYARRRGLLTRVMPRSFCDEGDAVRGLLQASGFRARPGLPTYRTILLDLSHSRETLQASLSRKWRKNLRQAEEQDVQIAELKGPEGIAAFLALYEQMHAHKRFVDFSDIQLFARCQARLPEAFRLRILACLHREKPVAAVALSLLGDTPVYHYGATNAQGRELRAGYRLHWWVVQWLREQGFARYDLGGLELAGEAGVNRFKTGLAGNLGRDVRLIGKYDACHSLASRATVRLGDGLTAAHASMRRLQRWLR